MDKDSKLLIERYNRIINESDVFKDQKLEDFFKELAVTEPFRYTWLDEPILLKTYKPNIDTNYITYGIAKRKIFIPELCENWDEPIIKEIYKGYFWIYRREAHGEHNPKIPKATYTLVYPGVWSNKFTFESTRIDSIVSEPHFEGIISHWKENCTEYNKLEDPKVKGFKDAGIDDDDTSSILDMM